MPGVHDTTFLHNQVDYIIERLREARHLENQVKALIPVQALARGKIARDYVRVRRRFNEVRERDKKTAATSIQSQWRRVLAQRCAKEKRYHVAQRC